MVATGLGFSLDWQDENDDHCTPLLAAADAGPHRQTQIRTFPFEFASMFHVHIETIVCTLLFCVCGLFSAQKLKNLGIGSSIDWRDGDDGHYTPLLAAADAGANLRTCFSSRELACFIEFAQIFHVHIEKMCARICSVCLDSPPCSDAPPHHCRRRSIRTNAQGRVG